jgi:hypothetical protein
VSGHADLADLAVGWVLHVLDPEQEAEFLAHLELEGCEECARLVADTSATFEALALAVPQEEPPADLRYRLLAAAEAERPAVDDEPAHGDVPFTGSPRSRGGVDIPPSPSPSSSSAGERATTVVPLQSRRRLGRVLTAVAAAVAVVVIGGLVVANQSLRAERDGQAATAQQYDRIVDVMRDAGAPGAVSAPLADPGGALVGLVVDRGAGPEVLATRLGVNGPDETYVLWALAGPAPRALGTFDVPDAGASVRSVPSSPVAGPVAGYAVSLEPGHAAPAAPTRIVASGQVGR